MKIYQFTPPPPLTEPRAPGNGHTVGKEPEENFASILKKAEGASTPSAPPEGPGRVISMENMRALSLPPASDLRMAGTLLNRVEKAIRAATVETLEKVHNLEGLLYIHNKNNV